MGTQMTREAVSRKLMSYARRGPDPAPRTYAALAIAWAVLHLAERVNELAVVIARNGVTQRPVDMPPREIDPRDAGVT